MLPDAPIGDCQYQPAKFAAPASKKEVEECKDICSRCPVLRECEEWVYRVLLEYNRGRRKRGLRPRTNIAGVIAGQQFHPTDGRGNRLNEPLIYQDFDQAFSEYDFDGYESGYAEHAYATRVRIGGRRTDHISEPHTRG